MIINGTLCFNEKIKYEESFRIFSFIVTSENPV